MPDISPLCRVGTSVQPVPLLKVHLPEWKSGTQVLHTLHGRRMQVGAQCDKGKAARLGLACGQARGWRVGRKQAHDWLTS